jgi:hypothetical protein
VRAWPRPSFRALGSDGFVYRCPNDLGLGGRACAREKPRQVEAEDARNLTKCPGTGGGVPPLLEAEDVRAAQPCQVAQAAGGKPCKLAGQQHPLTNFNRRGDHRPSVWARSVIMQLMLSFRCQAGPDRGLLVRELRHRIAWVMEAKDLSARGWGKAAGVSGPYITMLAAGKRGQRGLTQETAQKLADAAKISVTWLLTGEGQPEPGVSVPDMPEDVPPALEQALALLGDRIASPVRVALKAEKGGKGWSVDQWLTRARELQTAYTRVLREFDKPTDN